MNKKRYLLASLIVFVIIAALQHIYNNVCLVSLYETMADFTRPKPEMAELSAYGYIVYAIVALLFVYIFAKGYEGKGSGLGEGLRFGLIIGIFISLPVAGLSHILLPIPFMLSIYWFVMGIAECLIAGAAAGLIYDTQTA